MKMIYETISGHADRFPENIALQSGNRLVTYASLQKHIWNLASEFIENDVKILGLYLDNGVDWVLVDLAAQFAGITLVPLPAFFTARQINYIFEKANIDSVVSSSRNIIPESCRVAITAGLAPDVNLYKCNNISRNYNSLKNTGKITFTSGTTGEPKGVCLTNDSLTNVANSLVTATHKINIQKHLCLLPLTVLLENIAGVYAPLLKGATCQLPSLADTGLTGATGFNANKMLNCLDHYQPDSIILLPQMLHDLVYTIESDQDKPESLKFIAVGGGVISPILIKRAREKGLPVYEGYGLSECSSVVSINVPENDRPASAGKLIDNIQITISGENEIMLKGNFMQGYLGDTAIDNNAWYATGDIGKIDQDGYLHIKGRKKNIFITSYGRNVSPEWIESELLNTSVIRQVVVFGEAKPVNCAVIVPSDARTDDRLIARAIDITNRNLPEYAQIYYWIRAKQDFNLQNGLATANGRPVRERIYKLHEREIDSLFEQKRVTGRSV